MAAQCAALTVFLALFGCGGGGGGGEDDNGPESPGNNDPAIAPSNLAGQALTIHGTTTRKVAFSVSGNIWTEQRDGTFNGGTYEYSANGNLAELTLTDSGGDARIQLEFSTATSGSYRFVSIPDEGSFTLELIPQDNNGPVDPGNGSGIPPSSLEGLTLFGTRTYTSTGPVGQTHVYTFSGGTFHDSDPPEESDGAYLYEPSGNRARLTLNYYAPRMFNGDRHVIEMEFHSETGGMFESIYTRRDGTMIMINGTFRIE